MKTIILYAHPKMFTIPGQTKSVRNAMIIDKILKIPNVTYRNLFDLFNGKALLTEEQIQAEVEELQNYDRIMIQSPLYWYSMSYLGKTYIDQVFRAMWEFLPGKELGAIFTLGEKKMHAPTAEELGKPFELIAKRMEMTYFKTFLFCRDEGDEKIKEIEEELKK